MPTISQAITEGATRLRDAGIDQPQRTAGLLLGHVTGLDRTRLLTTPEAPIGEDQHRDYTTLVDRRAAGEPVQYLTGHQEFYGRDFIVTPDVLIPRPETEFLVERVIKIVGELKQELPLIVDLGTGSGCIAITLAKELRNARLVATDASSGALNIARKNAERHGVRHRIEFLEGDLLEPLREHPWKGQVDILASNPPYVNEEGCQLLQREVRKWEPHQALFGGADGLDFYRRVLVDAPQVLNPAGHVVLEIGFSQVDAVSEIVDVSALRLVDVTRDLQGIPRTLCLRKAC